MERIFVVGLFESSLTMIVAPITTAGKNVVTTVTVTLVRGIVRTALSTAANARAPPHPVVMLMSADQGLLHAGNSKTAVRLVMKGGRNVAPRNPILVRPVMNAVVKKGSGMKRMTDLKTALPGTLMAMRATGKTNAKELHEKFVAISPFVLGKNDYFGDVYMYQTPCGLPISLFSVPWPGTLS